MTETTPVRLRYWAAARTAAGTAEESMPVSGAVTLADVRAWAVAAHPDADLARVLGVCSVLVGEEPAGTRDPASVAVPPGATVEFLPPFAGG